MKNMTTYLGCITLALFVIYVTTNMLSLNNKVVEGLINKKQKTYTPDEVLTQLEKIRTQLYDELHIKKYATTYKKSLVALEDVFHLIMLSKIINTDHDEGWQGGTTPAIAKNLAEMQKATASLSNLDEFLTNYKSDSTTTTSSW